MEAIEIKSLQDLCNAATPENAERLGEDVKQWLLSYANTVELFRQANPEISKNLSNSEIVTSSFLWDDDVDVKQVFSNPTH